MGYEIDAEQFVVLFINAIVWFVFAYMMFNKARMLPFNGGFVPWFIGPFILYLIVSHFANKKLFNYTEWGKILGSFYLGLAIYLYLPIASASNPQLNWGRARTVEGFWHSVLRGQYEKPKFIRDGGLILAQIKLYLKDTWDQYPLVLIFAFVGILALIVLWKKTRMRDWLIYSVITFVFCGIGMVFMMNPKLDITSQYINRVFFIMSHAGLGLLVGYGMLIVVALLSSISKSKNVVWYNVALAIGLLFLAYGLFFTAVPVLKDSFQFPQWILSANSTVSPTLGIIFGLLFVFIGLFILLGVLSKKTSYAASILIALCILATPLIPATKHWEEMN